MKIRFRITLWITAAGVLVSLVLSAIIFFEMLEQPYDLLDKQLDDEARILIQRVKQTPAAGKKKRFDLKLPAVLENNYIRIFDPGKNIWFQTSLARQIRLPLEGTRQGSYTVNTTIPISRIRSTGDSGDPQDDTDQLAIRMKAFSLSVDGRPVVLQIGKPIEKLDEEITDLLWILGSGLFMAAVLLLLIGYAVAGKILQPINTINRLAREISDQTLDQRIPLCRSRDELYTLSESLNRMFDRLQHSFERQKEFIANASHELKSPLTLLQLSTEEIVQDPGIPPALRDRVQHHLDTLHRMRRLINNLLELSVLESKAGVDAVPVDLPTLIASVLRDFKPAFRVRRLAVQVAAPRHLDVEIDRQKMRRVLVNLMDNALKYSPEGGCIELALGAENGSCRLSFFNTGEGVPREDLDRVFDQFYRVEKSRSLQHGGSGLGLTIVKRIIELHGGRIAMHSQEGRGTRVEIHLPLRQAFS